MIMEYNYNIENKFIIGDSRKMKEIEESRRGK